MPSIWIYTGAATTERTPRCPDLAFRLPGLFYLLPCPGRANMMRVNLIHRPDERGIKTKIDHIIILASL
jgi:hypothetical protein